MKVNLKEVSVSGTYETLPAGLYTVKLMDYGMKTAQSGNEYMNCEFVIISGQYEGRKLWDKIVFTPTALWKLKSLALAVGFPKAEGEDVETDAIFDYARGVEINVKVVVESYTDRQGNKQQSNKIEAYNMERSIQPKEDGDVPF